MADSVEVAIHKGENKTLRFRLKDLDGDPINITGATIHVTVRALKTDPDPPLIAKDSDTPAEGQIVDGPGGVGEIYLVPADTTALDAGCYTLDAWVDNLLPSGTTHVLVPPSRLLVNESVRYS